MIVKLASIGLLAIKGGDAVKFLQGQLSCDVSKINEANASFGAHADPKGRLLSFFRIFMKEDAYILQLPKQSLNNAKNALEKYKVFYKSTLEDVSDQYECFGFIDEAPEVERLPDAKNNCVSNDKLTVLFCAGEKPRYEIIVQSGVFSAENGDALWHVKNIEAGYPQVYPETFEKLLPHYLNLNEFGALSFSKGCYTGQEIIARMEHLGKLKQKMYLLKGDATQVPALNTALFSNDQPVGVVIDAAIEGERLLLLAILPMTKIKDVIYLDELQKKRLTVHELNYRS